METQSDSNASGKTCTGKLCLAAAVLLVFGVGLFFLSLALDRFVQPHWRGIGDAFGCGIWASIGLVGIVVPLLGFIAVVDMLSGWRAVTNPDDVPGNESRIRTVARRFVVSSLLFAFVAILSIGIIIGGLGAASVPDLQGIWAIVMALLALVMGFISYRLLAKTSVRLPRRAGAIFSILFGLVAVMVVFLSTSVGNYLVQRVKYSKVTVTFSGDSDALKQTTIVPTLDSPCPPNTNVIWCSSFQLAWNRMKDDVIGEPVQVVGAEELAARLNYAEQSASDLESTSFYAAAGRIKDRIISRIEKDMAAKFPSHSVPDLASADGISDAVVAYSYLTANVPFKYPYRQVEDDFIFTDSNGIETNVGAFGVWGHGSRYKRIREQVDILYFREDVNETNLGLQIKEFAVDLCKYSEPYQVVAAIVEPKDSLAQTLKYIHNQIEDFRPTVNYQRMSFLGGVDVLMVPEMFWEIEHRFTELIGTMVANAEPPMPIVEASQGVRFKLDRYGAALESESTTVAFGGSLIYLRFNRPFLVYMKKRGCEQPFFVMWVDNAELLNKK
jgi:hypothetical protein